MEIASLWLIVGGSIVIFVGSVVGGFFGGLAFQVFYHKSLIRAQSSQRGVDARVEKAERMNAAVVEAAQLLQEGKKPDEILKALVPKYPDVAMDLVKKFTGKGLGGLLGGQEPG